MNTLFHKAQVLEFQLALLIAQQELFAEVMDAGVHVEPVLVQHLIVLIINVQLIPALQVALEKPVVMMDVVEVVEIVY